MPKIAMTRHQKIVSFKMSHMMAIIHDLKAEEGSKSYMYTKLLNLEEHIGRVLDCYRLEAFDAKDLDAASRLLDIMNAGIDEMFPPAGGASA